MNVRPGQGIEDWKLSHFWCSLVVVGFEVVVEGVQTGDVVQTVGEVQTVDVSESMLSKMMG